MSNVVQFNPTASLPALPADLLRAGEEMSAELGGGLQGRVFSAKGLVPPAGATNAIVFIEGTANFTATTVAKLFADAVAVTIP